MTAFLVRLYHRATERIVTKVSVHPTLYWSIRTITGSMDCYCLGKDTELVIEGYPRSGNTTTVYGFLERQERPVRVAHHKHHAAQLISAVRLGIPAVALVRNPRDAIISHRAFAEEERLRCGRSLRTASLTFSDLAASWAAFYRAILPISDRILVVPFEAAIADLEGVIEEMNARFHTSFRSDPEKLDDQGFLGTHALPNELRGKIKSSLSQSFAAELKRSRRLRARMEECSELFERLAGASHLGSADLAPEAPPSRG